ncbi:hypothetical protein GCM10027318_34000 [Massilia agilis]
MGWAVGFDRKWNRDIGYGVPAHCDHPDCNKAIDRGLAYVCGGEPYGGETGCGLFFCEQHLASGHCERCTRHRAPFSPKPDLPAWIRHKLKDESWQRWRKLHPKEVAALRDQQKRFRTRLANDI